MVLLVGMMFELYLGVRFPRVVDSGCCLHPKFSTSRCPKVYTTKEACGTGGRPGRLPPPFVNLHPPSYCAERDFVYNGRKLSDGERTEKALKGCAGKRLM